MYFRLFLYYKYVNVILQNVILEFLTCGFQKGIRERKRLETAALDLYKVDGCLI